MDDIDRGQEREQIDRELALQAALARGAEAEGGNGSCEDCGEVIDPRRLKIKPHALRCVDCQELWEHKCRTMHSS